MQLGWFEIMKQAPIKDLPMPVDVEVGFNWGDIEKGKDVLHTEDIDGLYCYNRFDEVVEELTKLKGEIDART